MAGPEILWYSSRSYGIITAGSEDGTTHTSGAGSISRISFPLGDIHTSGAPVETVYEPYGHELPHFTLSAPQVRLECMKALPSDTLTHLRLSTLVNDSSEPS